MQAHIYITCSRALSNDDRAYNKHCHCLYCDWLVTGQGNTEGLGNSPLSQSQLAHYTVMYWTQLAGSDWVVTYTLCLQVIIGGCSPTILKRRRLGKDTRCVLGR